ncbi:helix-turn-helix domain-containing protein [Scytonema sp. UIC 10036]|nr:helix-turn-helix domain-containing protein [Scytonema sp. UIC 10036]
MLQTKHSDIKNLIRELRQRLELTQEQLAHQLGVTYLTVNRWENNHSKPSPMAMKLIELKLKAMGELGEDLLKEYFAQ